MIGTKFAKPLQDDTVKISVTNTVSISEEVQVAYPVEREIQVVVQEPIYKTITSDDGEQIAVIVGYSDVDKVEKITDIEYRTETRTREEKQPGIEMRPNPAPNTYTKYREAVQWCALNNATLIECAPTDEYPLGYYEVQELPRPVIAELQKIKFSELKSKFTSIRDTAWVMSSLGFKADANDTANTDVEGLIKRMTALGETETRFCDFDNVEHNVTLEGLHTLQLEIIMNGQFLYKQKWDIRDAIKATKTKDELEAIEIKFTMMDFSA